MIRPAAAPSILGGSVKKGRPVVSSIRHSEIANEYNARANCLKSYLRYAEAMSGGGTSPAGP